MLSVGGLTRWSRNRNSVRPIWRRSGIGSPAPAVLSFTDATEPRRNRQPQAWQERSCDAVAAVSPSCTARRRADARAVAAENEVSQLDPRTVVAREAALIVPGRYRLAPARI